MGAVAQITFSFDFTADQTAVAGFYDPIDGATRRAALQSAANTLSSYLSGYPARTVVIQVDESQITNPTIQSNFGTLASAGSFVFASPGFQQGLVQQQILTGSLNAQPHHGTLFWNFTYNWDYDDSIASGYYDFKSVAMHELTHALGFASFINGDGTGLGAGAPFTWSVFDQFLTNSAGARLVDANGDFVGGTILTDGVPTLNAPGDVYFDGANAVAANGGNRVHIYSPATFEDGSSLSHLDTDFFGTNNYIMTHAVTTGPSVRTFSAIEIGILKDLGYNMAAVPEPATVALLLGAGAFGFVIWRRRRAA